MTKMYYKLLNDASAKSIFRPIVSREPLMLTTGFNALKSDLLNFSWIRNANAKNNRVSSASPALFLDETNKLSQKEENRAYIWPEL